MISLAGSATISWNANTDEDLAGYRIYYSTTKGGPYGSSTALIPKTQTSYTITSLSDGTYYFVVTAVDTADNESPYSAEASKTISTATSSSAVTSVTLDSNISSPQKAGTTVTFTAQASGGSGTYEYRFWRKRPDGVWYIAQDYTSNNAFAWDTRGAAGSNTISVHARNMGSTASYEVNKSLTYNIASVGISPAKLVTITPSISSPRKAGTTVTFTAQASGGSGTYEYRFWRKRPDGVWYVAQNYSSKSTFAWNTTGAAGSNIISVHARSKGSTANYDVYKGMTYNVLP